MLRVKPNPMGKTKKKKLTAMRLVGSEVCVKRLYKDYVTCTFETYCVTEAAVSVSYNGIEYS